MTRQTFDTADLFRLEVEKPRADGLEQLLPNTDGALGAFGWRSAIPAFYQISGGAGGTGIIFTCTSAASASHHSALFPVIAGQWLALRIDWWRSAGSSINLGFTIQWFGEHFDYITNVHGGIIPPKQTVPGSLTLGGYQVPINARYANVTLYDENGAAGQSFAILAAAYLSPSSQFPPLSPNPVTEWEDISDYVNNVRITREDFNLGTLTARLVRADDIDPATPGSLLVPGRQVRATALVDGAPRLLTGRITRAQTGYAAERPDGEQAVVTLTVADPNGELARATRTDPERHAPLALVGDLPSILGDFGIPYRVNGSPDQPAGLPVGQQGKRDANYRPLDLIGITRDTALAFAWVDRNGILNVYDRWLMPSPVRAILDEDDYNGDLRVGYDTSRLINEVSTTATTDDGLGNTTETAAKVIDPVSVFRHNTHTASFVIVGTDPVAYGHQVLALASTPGVVVESVTLPLTTAEKVAAYADLDIYDCVTVVNGPLGINTTLRIVGITHELAVLGAGLRGRWLMTLTFADQDSVAMPQIKGSR